MPQFYLKDIDRVKRILEIGPRSNPRIKKSEGAVFYADIRSTDEVRNFYKEQLPNDTEIHENICEIDYVISGSYRQSLSGVEKFDYVIACHVLEHIPRLIFFFQDIASVMSPEGRLCLTVPDKRYCFDHLRNTTSFAELYDIHQRGVDNLPARVLDQMLNSSRHPKANHARYWWKHNDYGESLELTPDFETARLAYERALAGEYIDVHFSVFTPESFLRLIHDLTKAALLPFRCLAFEATRPYEFDFNVVLQVDQSLTGDDNAGRERQMAHLRALVSSIKDRPVHLKWYRTLKYELLRHVNRIKRLLTPKG